MGMLAFGVGDLSNEYRYRHSQIPGGDYETLYARSRMVLAARLAGIDVIDAPFAGFRDQESGRKDADFSARLGFDGKSAISPRQIPGIHAAFDPSPKEISWAEEVMEAKREADRSGTAIFTVDGTMIDKPHFIMAERILARIGDQ
jgi:citrate lyase subunit beta/citryl-CoA lyase